MLSKLRLYLAAAATIGIVAAGIQSCKKDKTISSTGTGSTNTTATVSAIACSSGSFSATAVINTAYSGTATVPYTGGNGLAYAAGTGVSSTGVTGLTATLQAGTLLSGAGSFSYTISGIPTSSGTASFAITAGGQSCTLTLAVGVAGTVSDCSSATGVAKVVCLANAFLSTLSASQQASVLLTLNLSNAKRWSNLPCGLSCRNGILFSTLSTAQQTAALALIAAASGTATNEGYQEFQTIRAADDYLGLTASGYSAGNYVIAFLGAPSTTGKWMLQFGGHHYAQNITYDNSAVTSITPMHEAVEPNGSFTVNGTTYTSPMATELAAMRDMLSSFSTTELASAKISTTFSDCLLVPGSTTNTFPATKQGIKVSALSTTVQAKVLAAIAAWVNDVDPTTATTFLATYQGELPNTYVTYSANSSGTSGNASTFFNTNTDYIRIDGPSVWIEFVCQTGVVIPSQIHYHTVMRDHSRDYIGL